MFKKLWFRLFGINKIIEEAKQEAVSALEVAKEAQQVAEDATHAAKKAVEEEALAKLSPKERATAMKEPWVSVVQTHVNKENIRNGFFELDWNDYFIQQLIASGYGFESDLQEQIVDRWFRDLAANMLAEEGLDTNRSAGYVNVTNIGNNRSEIS